MLDTHKVVILKFGSSVLRSEEDLPRVVHEIYRWWRDGARVIAVVSAFSGTTDRLLQQAERVGQPVDPSMLANLLATGEAASSALLGLSLTRFGIPARVLDSSQAGLRTVGDQLDADLISVDSPRLFNEMEHAVVVLPGFVGRNDAGEISLLGRGGSDYSALFLAHYLKAHCVLIKDVDGLYVNSPSNNGNHGPRFEEVSYETAIRLAGSLVQNKAIRFAAEQRLNFTITGVGTKAATQVGSFSDRLDGHGSAAGPLRVTLLGCGTVGGGVYMALSELPDLFTIIGVGTRTVERAWRLGVPRELVTDDLESLVEKPADVVVELIGGTDRALRLTERALKLGRDVVTANKALIALAGESMKFLGHTNGGSLRYSAAVGGVMPALEAIQRVRSVSALRGFWGVLNGTTNFILDQLAAGAEFDAAVRVAQERGYAEADPRQDLDGVDAAHKLVILARAAFDLDLPFNMIKRRSLRELKAEAVRNAHSRELRTRYVASCRRVGSRLEAVVEPVELPLNHSLAHVRGTQNRLFIEPEAGEPVTVSGEGAGRWPTTEAVLADLFEVKVTLKEKQRRVVV